MLNKIPKNILKDSAPKMWLELVPGSLEGALLLDNTIVSLFCSVFL